MTANGAAGDRQEIAWAPDTPDTVYAAVSDGGNIKIWKSTDGGQNYTLQTTGSGIQTWSGYNNTIWVDPTDADTMILGGVYLYRSTDGGVTFTRRFNAVHADMHRIVQHPDFDGVTNKVVFFATDGGIYQTNDAYGTSAFDLNNNLGVTQFYGGGINPTTGNIMVGTRTTERCFIAAIRRTGVRFLAVTGVTGPPIRWIRIIFTEKCNGPICIARPTVGGSSGYIYGGPNPIGDVGNSATANFIPFFTLDPNNPNRMLVACERMW